MANLASLKDEKALPDNDLVKKAFVKGLLNWNEKSNQRSMPWKGIKDPYKIWLSEIILQQTRVDQGLKFYEKFINSFPNIQALAGAPEQQVYKLWEGLGYYSRCKNLINTARFIATELQGVFPNTYTNILQLKGIGPYTAAAIASFAYNLPYAVLDGNVFRVLSRILAISTPIDSTAGKKLFSTLAQQLLPTQQPAAYNQAIMDFGATICKPVPECRICFFNNQCKAFLQNQQQALPLKSKKLKVKERWFYYVVLQYQNTVAIRQRTTKDVWNNLYEFLLFETKEAITNEEVLALLNHQYNLQPKDYTLLTVTPRTPQKLSHQLIHFSFTTIELKQQVQIKDFVWVDKGKLFEYPFPKTLLQHVNDAALKLF